MSFSGDATAINAVPAQLQPRGFRLLVMREFRSGDTPPAFAYIAQTMLRRPERGSRHGVSFSHAFRPDIMDWLIARLGRPSQRDPAGVPRRNPRWPQLAWHAEPRTWADGAKTVEWFADVEFTDDATWHTFANEWKARLEGESEAQSG